MERRLAGRVGRIRIGTEVVVKGHILLEDDDQMLDRSSRVAIVRMAKRWTGRQKANSDRRGDRQCLESRYARHDGESRIALARRLS